MACDGADDKKKRDKQNVARLHNEKENVLRSKARSVSFSTTLVSAAANTPAVSGSLPRSTCPDEYPFAHDHAAALPIPPLPPASSPDANAGSLPRMTLPATSAASGSASLRGSRLRFPR